MTYQDYWLDTPDGLRLHARDYGTAGAGFPVLCLHGLTRNAADFEELAERLAPRHRVVVLEQRGRGRSDADPDPARYHLGTYVADTWTLMDALGLERPAVIGTSMGGLMAMLMGAAQPDRFRGLVLNDIGPVVEPSGLARIQGYVGKGGAVSTWEEAAQAARAINGAAFPDLTEADWLAFARRTFREADAGRLEPAYDAAIAQPLRGDAGTAVPPDLWPVFDGLGPLPLLVIRGALSDILSAATVAEMAQRHGDFEAVEVPRTGHAPLLSETTALTAIEGFLRRL